MNRRDFAKGLAALPLIGATKSFASICGSLTCHKPNSLQIVLQGPFAVVISKTSPCITVFTPRHNDEHMFSLNGLPRKGSKFKFELLPDNLTPPAAPTCVDNQFPEFCAENVAYDSSTDKHFITIYLPCPQRISVLSSPLGTTATMNDSKHTKVSMPGDRILEYDVPDPSKTINMTAWHENDKPVTITIPASNNPEFTFEVGLPQPLVGDADPDGSLAVDFYNNSILPYFPDLAKEPSRNILQIDELLQTSNRKISGFEQKYAQSHKGTAKRTKKKYNQEYVETYECKAGGLTVTSS